MAVYNSNKLHVQMCSTLVLLCCRLYSSHCQFFWSCWRSTGATQPSTQQTFYLLRHTHSVTSYRRVSATSSTSAFFSTSLQLLLNSNNCKSNATDAAVWCRCSGGESGNANKIPRFNCRFRCSLRKITLCARLWLGLAGGFFVA